MTEIRLIKEKSLHNITLFSELSFDQLRKISGISKTHKYAKGANLFLQDESYKGFYVLLKGSVKVYKISKSGRESVVHIVKPLNLFADIPLFEGGNYPVCADALEESLVLFVPKEGFIKLIKENHEISLKMLAGFAKRLKSLVGQIEDLKTKEVVNRVAKYLVKEIHKSGTENLPEPFVKLTVPKSTIASYLGTITETLSRTFKKLQDDGILRVQTRKIFVADYARLKKLAQY